MKRIFKSYQEAWKNTLYNWRIILLLYIFLLLTSFIALGPLSNVIDSVFGNRLILNDFLSGFDYTSIIDLINHHGVSVKVSLSSVLSFFVVYILWSAFYSGGLMEMSKHRNIRSSRLIFWKGGAQYFFRYFRLTIYLIVIYACVLVLFYMFFAKDGFNPLHIESEQIMITRFRFLLVALVIIGFFLAIFRDLAKALISERPNTFVITWANLGALKRTFLPKYILLSLLNLLLLGMGFALYLLIKQVFGPSQWALIIVSQLFIIYRIAYRIVRLFSFNYEVVDSRVSLTDHTPKDHDMV